MKKNYRLIFGVVALVVIIVAGYLILTTGVGQQNKTVSSPTNQNANQQPVVKSNTQLATVTLTNSGFNPVTLTVKPGTRVIWLNKSGTSGSVNSDNHPTNLLFPFLNLGQFNDGSSVSVVFKKAGKYTYHNEVNPDQKGTVIVKE